MAKAKEQANKLREMGADVGGKVRDSVTSLPDKARDLLAKFIAPIDEDEQVRKICETVVRLALPSRREKVKEHCERHARAVIRRLNNRLHPELAVPEEDPELADEVEETPENSDFSLEVGSGKKNDVVHRLCSVIGRIIPDDKKDQVRADCEKRVAEMIEKVKPAGDKLAETTEKVKQFLKGLGVRANEKYSKFSEWLKSQWSRGLDRVQDETTRMREVALRLKEKASETSAETLKQAVEALEPFRTRLGQLFDDLKAAAKRAAEKLNH